MEVPSIQEESFVEALQTTAPQCDGGNVNVEPKNHFPKEPPAELQDSVAEKLTAMQAGSETIKASVQEGPLSLYQIIPHRIRSRRINWGDQI